MKQKIGLVLEGGGMRGIFTAGVLDYFLEQELVFDGIIGVSAGAIHACSYISKQKYRSKDITLTYIRDKRYCSLNSLIKTGDLFNAQFAYYDIPEQYFKFDHKTFNKSKTKLYVVATDIVRGKPKYLQIKNFDHGEMEFLRASASLPFVANIIEYQGKKYLDGGLSDQIPIKKMEQEGYEKNIVITTKLKGWRRSASRSYLLCKRKYKKYPKIGELLKERHILYNETMDYLDQQVARGKVFMIGAESDLGVKRIDKNIGRLEKAYQAGYETAKRLYPELIKFLNE